MSGPASNSGATKKLPPWIGLVGALIGVSLAVKMCTAVVPASTHTQSQTSYVNASIGATVAPLETPHVDVLGTVTCKGSGETIKTLAAKGGDDSVVVRAPGHTAIYWFRTDTHESTYKLDKFSFCDATETSHCATDGKLLSGSIPRFRVSNLTSEPVPLSCEYDPES